MVLELYLVYNIRQEKYEEYGTKYFFKPMQYNRMLLKYFMNTYYIDFLYKNTNFKDTFSGIRNEDSFRALNVLFQEEGMWKEGTTKGEIAENIKKLKESQVIKNKKYVDRFLIILYNKTLIMMCTIFDTFSVDCMEMIINNNSKTIKAFANDNDISLDDIINIEPEDIFKNVQKKCLKKFDFGGIGDKIKYLDKLGIKKEELFNLNPKMIQEFPEPEKFLREEIYERRHLVVHKNEMSIEKYEELNKVFDFLNHLMFFWDGIVFVKHFHITSDLALTMNK